MKIGYARVSTGHQDLQLQIEALKAAGCEKIFSDTASGKKDDRAGLMDALVYARNGSGDEIVIYKLDRLSRTLSTILEIAEGLLDRDIGLTVLTGSMSQFSGPQGKLMLSILGAVAEFERELIRERVTAGVRRSRDAGTKWGRPQVLDDEARQVAESLIRDRDVSGLSMSEIAERVGCARSTLYREFPGGRV